MLKRRPAPAPPTTAPARPVLAPPVATPAAADPPGARSTSSIVVLDSLRYDSWLAADTPNLDRLGPVERRWSYAIVDRAVPLQPAHAGCCRTRARRTCTRPSTTRHDFLRYSERLGIDGIEFKRLLPALYLPTYLQVARLPHRTHACRCRCSTRTPASTATSTPTS